MEREVKLTLVLSPIPSSLGRQPQHRSKSKTCLEPRTSLQHYVVTRLFEPVLVFGKVNSDQNIYSSKTQRQTGCVV